MMRSAEETKDELPAESAQLRQHVPLAGRYFMSVPVFCLIILNFGGPKTPLVQNLRPWRSWKKIEVMEYLEGTPVARMTESTVPGHFY